MTHSFLVSRAVRNSKGQFTGQYKLGLGLPGLGKLDKGWAGLQIAVLVLVYLGMVA
jgi:hypothetical protein